MTVTVVEYMSYTCTSVPDQKNLKVENWDWSELGERRLEGLKHVQILGCLNFDTSYHATIKMACDIVTSLLVTYTSLFMVA